MKNNTPYKFTMGNKNETNGSHTLEGAKELIAKQNGFKSWEELQLTWLNRVGQVLVVHENYVDQMFTLTSAPALLKENQELKAFVMEVANIHPDGNAIYLIQKAKIIINKAQ